MLLLTLNLDACLAEIQQTEYYGSLDGASCYFETKIDADIWVQSSEKLKRNSLIESTRLIDRLFYIGYKADEDQELEFPRYGQSVVPKTIEYACYELALRLLNEINPEEEFESLSITSSKFASISTTYDRKVLPENIIAGIPSLLAWNYLLPYLIDSKSIRVRRV